MQRFTRPDDARELLQAQHSSEEALEIKRSADPLVDFCGYLTPLSTPTGLFIGNANIRPMNPRRYLYHAYLAYMKANGYKNPLSMKMFGLSLESIMQEYGHHYLKRRTKLGMQTNLDLTEESSSDWLPKCDAPTAIWLTRTGESRFFYAYASASVKNSRHPSPIKHHSTRCLI